MEALLPMEVVLFQSLIARMQARAQVVKGRLEQSRMATHPIADDDAWSLRVWADGADC
jgi:hypothetical protein